jgi:hypothetical protein
LAALIAKYEKEAPYNIASVYAYRGEADKAFAWLEKRLPGPELVLAGTRDAGGGHDSEVTRRKRILWLKPRPS